MVRYPYVHVDVAEQDADEASALLFELGARGVEQRDTTTLVRGGGAGVVTLVASFEGEDDARTSLGELPPDWAPRLRNVEGDGWRDEWKKYFEPFRLCDRIVVRPPWREYRAEAGETVVVLEPGRAFGTGLHETTSLVADLLAEHAPELGAMPLLDVGCGSGILSLAALALGAKRVRALDVDPDAVAATHENAERNAMSDRIEADAARIEDLAGTFAPVVANIESRTLVEIAPSLIARTAPGGLVVVSGVLAEDAAPGQLDSVRAAYRGLRLEEVRRKGEWVAVAMRREG